MTTNAGRPEPGEEKEKYYYKAYLECDKNRRFLAQELIKKNKRINSLITESKKPQEAIQIREYIIMALAFFLVFAILFLIAGCSGKEMMPGESNLSKTFRGGSVGSVTAAPAEEVGSLKPKSDFLAVEGPTSTPHTKELHTRGGGRTFILKTFTDHWLQPGGYNLEALPVWWANVLENPLGTKTIYVEYTK